MNFIYEMQLFFVNLHSENIQKLFGNDSRILLCGIFETVSASEEGVCRVAHDR